MKIQNKFFLILFGFSFILVAMLVLLMQWSIGKGMVDYVNTKEIEALKPVVVELTQEYRKNSGWHDMAGNNHKFRRLITAQLRDSDFDPKQKKRRPEHKPFRHPPPKLPGLGRDKPPPRGDDSERRLPPPPENEAHYALLDGDEELVVGSYLDGIEYSKTAIIIDGASIGFFAVSKRNQLTQGYEVDFIEQQRHYLWIIALLAMCLVALVTLPLARHLVEPIKLITRGMHKLTQGDYQQSIDLNRQDELGELSRDYNELALTLAENETARKRWLANISHELRTPVAILRGELEAMLDDVRPLNRDNVSSANDEVKHLQRLIDDLNLLTSADIGGMRYRKSEQDFAQLILGEIEKYRGYLHDAKIKLNVDISERAVAIYGDKTRLLQLFENIFNNCIKYSSATLCKLSLQVENNHGKPSAVLKFEDDGIGVDTKHLAHLFEHLYRVDDSRNRKSGGSGLGLSICRHIVIAHQGDISAQQADLGGLAIIIRLPMV